MRLLLSVKVIENRGSETYMRLEREEIIANEEELMMKGTSLASTVTIMDLTGVAKYIISTTFKPIEVFIVAGGIYLFMTFIIHNMIKFLEKKYGFQS